MTAGQEVAVLMRVASALGLAVSGRGGHLASLRRRYEPMAILSALLETAQEQAKGRTIDQPLEYVAGILKGGDASCLNTTTFAATTATGSPPVSAGELAVRTEALYNLTARMRLTPAEANEALDSVPETERGTVEAWLGAALKARGG